MTTRWSPLRRPPIQPRCQLKAKAAKRGLAHLRSATARAETLRNARFHLPGEGGHRLPTETQGVSRVRIDPPVPPGDALPRADDIDQFSEAPALTGWPDLTSMA